MVPFSHKISPLKLETRKFHQCMFYKSLQTARIQKVEKYCETLFKMLNAPACVLLCYCHHMNSSKWLTSIVMIQQNDTNLILLTWEHETKSNKIRYPIQGYDFLILVSRELRAQHCAYIVLCIRVLSASYRCFPSVVSPLPDTMSKISAHFVKVQRSRSFVTF